MEQVGNLVPSLLNSGAERDLPVANRQSLRPPGRARRGADILTGPMPVNGYERRILPSRVRQVLRKVATGLRTVVSGILPKRRRGCRPAEGKKVTVHGLSTHVCTGRQNRRFCHPEPVEGSHADRRANRSLDFARDDRADSPASPEEWPLPVRRELLPVNCTKTGPPRSGGPTGTSRAMNGYENMQSALRSSPTRNTP